MTERSTRRSQLTRGITTTNWKQRSIGDTMSGGRSALGHDRQNSEWV